MDGKNYKQLINEHCQREKMEKAEYVCTPDQERNPNGFFCTLTVGGQSYCTSNWQKTKKSAELEAAKIACEKLNLQKTNTELKAEKLAAAQTTPTKTNGIEAEPGKGKPVAGQPGGKDPEWITIEKVEDIYKYLTDEVLAQEFKAFLHCKAQEEKKGYPVFTTKDAQPKGFKSTVTYDGKEYHSLGVMMSKKQAEQSAAEVCLRSLGDFPNVPKDKYTIQVYRGGQVHLQPRRQERTTKYTHSLLQGFIASLGHQFPQYCYKETDSGHEAVCYFEGKTFQSGTAETLADAKNRAAFEALKFFGFDEAKSKEAGELRDMLRIKHRKSFIPIGVLMSPLVYCPSKRPGWMFYHFESTDQITAESGATIKECENMFNIKKWTPLSAEQLMSNIFDKPPSIDGKPLNERSDLSVGEIFGENKNVAIIGNEQCSFRMFCQDGKITCKNRKCDVELLPGHNIRGLKCSYKLLFPSLQIYLQAEACDDLFYPNPPLPVVTSCGMVALMFDHESVKDIQILLTRPSNQKTFATKARSLASYLNKLINQIGAQSQSTFDVAEFTANIESWTRNEVRLLSEMTMESLHELMSPYVRYDDRWNEIFARERPDVLKELEDAGSAELSRRTEEGVEDEVNTDPWVLPNSKFAHRLLQTGVLVENQLMCTFRSLLEMTGLKIKLGELETSPYVDIPCEDNTNPHRGDSSRYYIWTGMRTVNAGEDEMYYKGSEILKQLGEDWIVDGELDRRTARNAKRRQGKEKPRNKKQKLQEGAAETTIKTEDGEEKPAAAAEDDEKTAPVEETEEKPVAENEKPAGDEEENKTTEETEQPPPAAAAPVEEKRREREPRGARSSKAIQEEVRWFPLEEAKELCPMLNKISSTAHFLGQVQSLQTQADTFMEQKTNGAV